jgi:acyl-CoA thioester hydrolase
MEEEKNYVITHRYPIRIRYADTDMMGFVYNGNYLKFFEIGRTELMRHYNLVYSELEKSGYQLPLTEAYVKYHNAAVYDDLLEIETLLELNSITSKLKFKYNVLRDNELIASGYTVHIFMKIETKKAVRPPMFFMEGINQIKINHFS